MAVRGLSQAVSDSQGWSLHKAILQSLKKCYIDGKFENVTHSPEQQLEDAIASYKKQTTIQGVLVKDIKIHKNKDAKIRFSLIVPSIRWNR